MKIPKRLVIIDVVIAIVSLCVASQNATGQQFDQTIDFVPSTCVDTGSVVAPNSMMCVVYYAVSPAAKQSLSDLSSAMYSLSYSSLDGKSRSASIRAAGITLDRISFLFRVPVSITAGSYLLSLSGPRNITVVPTVPFSVFSSQELDGVWPLADSIEVVNQRQFGIYGRFRVDSNDPRPNMGVFVIAEDGSMTYADQTSNTLALSAISPRISLIGVAQDFPVRGTVVVLIQHGSKVHAVITSNELVAPARPLPPLK